MALYPTTVSGAQESTLRPRINIDIDMAEEITLDEVGLAETVTIAWKVALIRAETPLSVSTGGVPRVPALPDFFQTAGLVTAHAHTLYHMLLGGDLFGVVSRNRVSALGGLRGKTAA